jgi:2-oxoglutarate dehydrogenase E1 component
MYKRIATHPGTVEIYSKRLIADGVMTEGEVEKAKADWRARLDAELEAGSGYKPNKADWLDGKWAGFKSADQEEDARRGVTGVDASILKDIGRKITKVPDGFRVHRTIQRFLENRAKAIDNGIGIDWATGEALAFCTLLQEGHHVRLSGQDSERGTFSQRHSVLIDQEDESRYTPFNHLGHDQGHYEVINSLLSEEAVLGFEYGYSLAEPPTAPRCYSTSSSRRASANGCACPASSACCRMAMKGRGRSIPRRGSSAFCRCARKTTCRWSIRPRRRITSTCCGASCIARSASL